MNWKKLGLIFDPTCLKSIGLSAALMPIAKVIDESIGIIRVYFSPRDKFGRSQVRFFDFDISNLAILKISEHPIILPGKLGAFDDSGITNGSILTTENKTYLYYTGWNRTVNVPMNNSIGIAILDQQNKFSRIGDGPIMGRTLHEPYSCASPFVLKKGTIFKMWYASMDKWENVDNIPKHFYNIKYAESQDGINWSRTNQIAIDYETEDEFAFGRPFVMQEGNLFKMWYSFRGKFYKIGYAESNNGVNWIRKDKEAGIDVSLEGWDSEMIEYPFIFECMMNRYMLYNGNDYGKSGIGLAIYES